MNNFTYSISKFLYNSDNKQMGKLSFFDVNNPTNSDMNLGYCLNSIRSLSPKLQLKAGVIIKSDDTKLIHGISGMDFCDKDLCMVSDCGISLFYQMRPIYTNSTLTDLTFLKSSNFFNHQGNMIGSYMLDLEEIKFDGQNFFVSTEMLSNYTTGIVFQENAIFQFNLQNFVLHPIETPKEFSTLAYFHGIEAFAVSKTYNNSATSHKFIAFEERGKVNEELRVFIWENIEGKLYQQQIVNYSLGHDFCVTSAAFLSENKLLILERKSEGRFTQERADFTTIIKLAEISQNDEGFSFKEINEIAIIDPHSSCSHTPLNDNFESITVKQNPNSDSYTIFIASDDNIKPLQNTILLQFELTDAHIAGKISPNNLETDLCC